MWPATLPSSGFDHIFSTLTRHLSTLTGHLPSLRGTRFHLLWLYYTLHHHLRRYMNRPPSPYLQCASIRQLQHTVDCLVWANDLVHRSIGHLWETVWREGQHAWEGIVSDLVMGVGVQGRDRAVLVCVVIGMLCLVWLVWSVWSLQRVRTVQCCYWKISSLGPGLSSLLYKYLYKYSTKHSCCTRTVPVFPTVPRLTPHEQHIQQSTCSCVRRTATSRPYSPPSQSRTDRRHVHFINEADADEDDPVQLQSQLPSRTLAQLDNHNLYRRLGGYLVPKRSAHWPEYYQQAIIDAMATENGIIRLERKQVKRDMRDNMISFERGVSHVPKHCTRTVQCDLLPSCFQEAPRTARCADEAVASVAGVRRAGANRRVAMRWYRVAVRGRD